MAGVEYVVDVAAPDTTSHLEDAEHSRASTYHVRMFRQLGNMRATSVTPWRSLAGGNATVNIIIAASGHATDLRRFLAMLNNATLTDRRVRLGVVLFRGNDSVAHEEAVRTLHRFHASPDRLFDIIRVAVVHAKFSRALGLTVGAGMVDEGGLLMFADINAHVTPAFLHRCRTIPTTGRTVYFPVPFALYEGESPDIRTNGGYWRTSSFVTACFYRADFHGVGKFGAPKTDPWAGDDAGLLDRFAQRNYTIVRVPDPDLFEVWRPPAPCAHIKNPRSHAACQSAMYASMGNTQRLGEAIVQLRERHEAALRIIEALKRLAGANAPAE